jgi:hypothetical protein
MTRHWLSSCHWSLNSGWVNLWCIDLLLSHPICCHLRTALLRFESISEWTWYFWDDLCLWSSAATTSAYCCVQTTQFLYFSLLFGQLAQLFHIRHHSQRSLNVLSICLQGISDQTTSQTHTWRCVNTQVGCSCDERRWTHTQVVRSNRTAVTVNGVFFCITIQRIAAQVVVLFESVLFDFCIEVPLLCQLVALLCDSAVRISRGDNLAGTTDEMLLWLCLATHQLESSYSYRSLHC